MSMTEKYLEDLIRKFAAGTATEEEVNTLNDWYRSGPTGEVQWPSGDASEKDNVSRRILNRLKTGISKKPAKLIRFPWMKVAATLFIFLGVASILIYLIRPTESFITVVNPPGKIEMVTLPDNSRVWLNGSTSLSYAETFKNNRRVKLNGEAYFEVTHDHEHPFSVTAGEITTIVKGTTFNIKSYPQTDVITVSLLSGRVLLAEDTKELAELTPSTQYRFNKNNKTGKILPIDTSRITAWKKGLLQFAGEAFSEIAVVLENWYDTKINFASPDLLHCRFYMSFDNTTPLPTLLSTLSRVTEMDFRFNIDSSVVTISGKGCN